MTEKRDWYYINRVLNGDTHAYSYIVDRYKDLAYTVALRIVKNSEEAEEIAQDAFIKAFKSLNKFKGDAKFSTWLYKIIYNSAISHIRKYKPEISRLDTQFMDSIQYDEHLNGLSKMQADEQRKYIDMALNLLQPEESFILSLFYLQENSIDEIAEITNLSKSNIKVKLHRSRKKMLGQITYLLKDEAKNLL